MKFVINVFLVSLFLTACGVEVTTPKPEEPKKDPLPTTKVVDTKLNPLEGVCSYNEDKNKGCVKAVVATTQLSVDNFYYELGVKAFAKNLPTDLVESDLVSITSNQTLEFSRVVTEKNFHSNFSITVEGTHSTYDSINLPNGNIQVNKMAPGSYSILVTKDFDFKVLNKETSKTEEYRCVTIWSRYQVEILSGQETALPEAVSQFEFSLPAKNDEKKSCNRAKVKATTTEEDSSTESPSKTKG